MKIGIGITTYDTRSTLDQCLDNIYRRSKWPYELHVAKDSDKHRLGVAKRKNQCLDALKHCDHVFLFDDDCWPKRNSWADKFVEFSEAGMGEHFQYSNSIKHGSPSLIFKPAGILEVYPHGGAPFMYMSKNAIEKVGGFYTGYGLYGFEHIGWSCRAYKAGLTLEKFTQPAFLSNFLYAADYDHTIRVKSSITDVEKASLTKIAEPAYDIDIQQIYRPITW
jgi:hypothetical protein